MGAALPARVDARRRGLVAGAAAALLAPRVLAQGRMKTVGYLGNRSPPSLLGMLADPGWVEGRNLRVEWRGDDRGRGADAAAAELARIAPDVLAASGAVRVVALARATKTIPVVSMGMSDPVSEGVARSLREPDTNVTGLSFGLPEAALMQFGTLRALLPGLRRVSFIVSPDRAGSGKVAPAHAAAVVTMRLELDLVEVKDLAEVERALDALRRPDQTAAWVSVSSPAPGEAGVAQAATCRRIATHGMNSEAVKAGLLFSCWTAHSDPLRRSAAIIDKVPRGAQPAQIPFELPDQSIFALNRATARALGLSISPEILLGATEVFD